MSVIPPAVSAESRTLGNELHQESLAIIQAYFKNKPEGLIPGADGVKIDDEERNFIIAGIALRMTNSEITRNIKRHRKETGNEINFSNNTIGYYRKKYAGIIDEIWLITFERITEIYSFTDKVYRAGRYHDIANALFEQVMPELKSIPDEMTIKKTNVLLKVMAAIHTEMGAYTHKDLILKGRLLEEGQPEPVNESNALETAQQLLEARYSDQLPSTIREKIDYSDYSVCGFSEKMGEITRCFNSVMTNGDNGAQCKVQKGDIQVCPKCINGKLLDSKEFLERARQVKNSLNDIAILAGVTFENCDTEIRDKIRWFMTKHDVPFSNPRDHLGEYLNDGSDRRKELMNESIESAAAETADREGN